MFSWFKKKRNKSSVLYLKSTDAAFEYASKYMQHPLLTDAILIGQVLTKAEPDRIGLLGKPSLLPKWRVRLATEHGIIQTDNCGSIAEGLASDLKLPLVQIKSGDLVAVQVAAYNPKYAMNHPAQYFLVLCKLKAEIDIESHSFNVDAR